MPFTPRITVPDGYDRFVVETALWSARASNIYSANGKAIALELLKVLARDDVLPDMLRKLISERDPYPTEPTTTNPDVRHVIDGGNIVVIHPTSVICAHCDKS